MPNATRVASAETWARIFDAAQGLTRPDLVIRNCRVVNVYTGEVETTNIQVTSERIVGLDRNWDQGHESVDADGLYAIPGLLDGHMHIEATLLLPSELARLLVPRGVTALFADLHEVANVLGREGLALFLKDSESTPLRLFLQVPSFLPLEDAQTILSWDSAVSVGETGFNRLLSDPNRYLSLYATARQLHKGITGHAAGLRNSRLTALAAVGQQNDHECLESNDARERLRRGTAVMVRDGSTEQNLADLIPAIADQPAISRHCMFCTDDKLVSDILNEGHLDSNCRKAVQLGLDPVIVIQMATLNCAQHHRLDHDLGSLAPGRLADIVLVQDLRDFKAVHTFIGGKEVARDGQPLWERKRHEFPLWSTASVHLKRALSRDDLVLKSNSKRESVRVLRVQEGQIIKKAERAELDVIDGGVHADIGRDVLHLAVVERNRGTGEIARAFTRGFGLKAGAIASTVAHDHHNVVIVGVSEEDMALSVNTLRDIGGGFVVVRDGQVLASLPLSLAGLVSLVSADETAEGLAKVESAAKDLGCPLRAPFMTLSFATLPGVPELGLTERGLVDVESGQIVSAIL